MTDTIITAIRQWMRAHCPRLLRRVDFMVLSGLLWTLDGTYPVTDVTYDLADVRGTWMLNLTFTAANGTRHVVELDSDNVAVIMQTVDALAREVSA